MTKRAFEIASRLAVLFPDAHVAKTELPSGVVWIDLRRGNVFVTIECSLNEGYGVSLVNDGDPGFGGHDKVFSDPDDVVSRVEELLVGGESKAVS